MFHSTKQIDLIHLTGLGEDPLGFMTFFDGEDGVGFWPGEDEWLESSFHFHWIKKGKDFSPPQKLTSSRNRQGTLDRGQFVLIDETGMSHVGGVHLGIVE